jgi:hypothetical protein
VADPWQWRGACARTGIIRTLLPSQHRPCRKVTFRLDDVILVGCMAAAMRATAQSLRKLWASRSPRTCFAF